MPVDWMNVENLSFNNILLLERIQLSWFPGWVPESDLAIALHGNPHVAWYIRHKCPEVDEWIDGNMSKVESADSYSPSEIRQAELKVLETINDLIVYVVDPSIYDAQPFLGWDTSELTSLVDFRSKVVLDIGSGTGRLALIAAETAHAVYAVEPVSNLRRYLREKARCLGFRNLFPVDGLITDIPFEDGFADVTMGGHVFGDNPQEEIKELMRVTKTGGMVILCPGNVDEDNDAHLVLVSKGFQWSRFEEPEDGMKRKYWRKV
ncbi:MAG: methyltransferase domain-containing protein [Anaerolineales bacterium]|nr:methyltransferase domain-containing protein [Anaerolineales bacterium]